MKIKEIEGTPKEISEYLRENPELLKLENPPVENPFSWWATKKSLSKKSQETVHWSSTKHQWVSIKSMNSSYILNIIKKMFRDNHSNEWLLSNDEFKALIINLADKIEEEETSCF